MGTQSRKRADQEFSQRRTRNGAYVFLCAALLGACNVAAQPLRPVQVTGRIWSGEGMWFVAPRNPIVVEALGSCPKERIANLGIGRADVPALQRLTVWEGVTLSGELACVNGKYIELQKVSVVSTTSPTAKDSTRTGKREAQPSVATAGLSGSWKCEYGDLLTNGRRQVLKFDTRVTKSVGLDYVNMNFKNDGTIDARFSDNSGWRGRWSKQTFSDNKGKTYAISWVNENEFFALNGNGLVLADGIMFGLSNSCKRIR
jgi:hypothetical protein